MFHDVSWKPVYFESRHVSLHSCEYWFLLVYICLQLPRPTIGNLECMLSPRFVISHLSDPGNAIGPLCLFVQ